MRGGQGSWREAEVLLLRQGLLVAGCTPECDVVVSEEGVDEGVSCEHAWLRVEGLLCYLRDGGSTHGAQSATRTRLCPRPGPQAPVRAPGLSTRLRRPCAGTTIDGVPLVQGREELLCPNARLRFGNASHYYVYNCV